MLASQALNGVLLIGAHQHHGHSMPTSWPGSWIFLPLLSKRKYDGKHYVIGGYIGTIVSIQHVVRQVLVGRLSRTVLKRQLR